MKKINVLFMSLALLLLTALVSSCSDDKKEAVVPTLDSITFTPSACNGGDLIKATVKYKEKGEYCSLYKGTIEYDGVPKVVNVATDENGNITFSFNAPKVNRRLQISFFLEVSLHAGNTLYGKTNTVKNILDITTIEEEDEE